MINVKKRRKTVERIKLSTSLGTQLRLHCIVEPACQLRLIIIKFNF